jgi:hypothetical protein
MLHRLIGWHYAGLSHKGDGPVRRTTFALIAVLIAAVGGYVAAGPFITLHGMKVAIKSHDSERLSGYIDFPMLRSNLKEQLNAAVMKESTSQMRDNPFAILGMAVASKLAESLVETAVTPSGLANLMQGRKPASAPIAATPASANSLSTTPESVEPFRNARYTFDNTERFSAWVKNENGEEIRFVLSRIGFSWKLTNIVIPMKG